MVAPGAAHAGEVAGDPAGDLAGDPAALITEALRTLPPAERLILPALQAVQAACGYVPEAAVARVADELNVSRAEVHGVLTFYDDLRRTPPPEVSVAICCADACQSVGARELLGYAGPGAPSVASGTVEVHEVACLGACALGPAAMVQGRLLSRVDGPSLDRAVASAGVWRPANGTGTGESGAAGSASLRVRVPADSVARSVGADEVATALRTAAHAAGVTLELVRTGSRGLLWQEPLVEVHTPAGWMGFGPVTPADAAGLLEIGAGAPTHPLALGPVDALPWLTAQTRSITARLGVIDPLDHDAAVEHGLLRGLRAALTAADDDVISEVLASGLRGRGGAGFPAGIKWRTVRDAEGTRKLVCCNADEGDSGTFADRMVMEGDPLGLLEGMAIAGLVVGAAEGIVYVRSEYPAAIATMRAAVEVARAHGWLGPDVLGSGRAFDVRIVAGAGSYVCGEETAMLASIEGGRGMVRPKPPIPALSGAFDVPTLVHNVLTLASIPAIVADGSAAYQSWGIDRSRGTQVFQLAGNIARGGLVEVPFGITLRELVEGFGGGTRTGRPIGAVQVGGPLGSYLGPEQLDVRMDYESLAEIGGMLGHGGLVVFDDTIDFGAQARWAMEFCARESCGRCTPCRVGSVRGVEVIDRILAADDDGERDRHLVLLEDLCEAMTDGSMCAMGGLTPLPVRSAMARHLEQMAGADMGGAR